jgi:beta-galactosidase
MIDGLEPSTLLFGADYNPEQWPDDLLDTDIALMLAAGVNRVSLGIFSWAKLEPRSGRFEGAWLERILDALDAAGIGVNLATPTASPPNWLLVEHPEIQLVDVDGRRIPPGGRLSWCPSSPVFREHAARVIEWLATTFGGHPAVRLWHISNEFGNENPACYCEDCAAAFRLWLAGRFDTIAELNEAWGTAFWGHQYGSFAEILPPRTTHNPPDPAIALDYRRFCSDQLLAHYSLERAILLGIAPDVPATTNFMISKGTDTVDHARWIPALDLVSNDHYTTAADPDRHRELALSANRTRGLAGGAPWLLMEHSTSAVNWQPRNRAKEPGEMMRDSLSHIARGADGAMFFQWRASLAGSEQFHSAMLPHAGTESRIWREVVALGDAVQRLAPVRGSRVETGTVALLWDVPSYWATQSSPLPTVDFHYDTTPTRFHHAISRRRVALDIVTPAADLAGRRVVIVPSITVEHSGLADRLRSAAESGAHIVISAFTGLLDESGSVLPGGYPGAFRELIGGSAEELYPLAEGETVRLDNGWRATVCATLLHAVDSEVVSRYAEGPLAGEPAILVRAVGAGSVIYLGCELDDASIQQLVDSTLEYAEVTSIASANDDVDLCRRVAANGDSFLFCINHTDHPAEVQVAGIDLLSGVRSDRLTVVKAGGVAVIAEDHTHGSEGAL